MPGSPIDRSLAAELVKDLTATATETAPILAPFTGQVLHELPTSTVQDVADAAARAREAQRAWWAAGFAHRRKVLLKAHDLILERRETAGADRSDRIADDRASAELRGRRRHGLNYT